MPMRQWRNVERFNPESNGIKIVAEYHVAAGAFAGMVTTVIMG
jgi:hypothetical protein